MRGKSDQLEAARLFGSGGLVGAEGEVHESVDSTMDLAARRAAEGAVDGYVVAAEHQRAGRGRVGRWECPAGMGLLLSVVLRRGFRRGRRRLVSLLGAVGAAEALRDFCPAVRIKWPNDIVVVAEGEPLRVRKLGGVLVEQCPQQDAAPAHVLGVGINVNHGPEDLPGKAPIEPTSLKIELGGIDVDRRRVAARLLEKLDTWYQRLRMDRPEALLARWRSLSCLLEREVRARVEDCVLEGRVRGLRASGELILELPGGRQELLSSERATLLLGEKS